MRMQYVKYNNKINIWAKYKFKYKYEYKYRKKYTHKVSDENTET